MQRKDVEFKVGDHVQIRPEHAQGYVQPWRSRIEKGLYGQIVGRNNNGSFIVQLVVPPRVKYAHEWKWRYVEATAMRRAA